jgi:hypothetical protein
VQYVSFPSRAEYVRAWRSSGVIGRKLGEGSYSAVYEGMKPGQVVKITSDSSTVHYLLQASMFVERGDRHFPRIFSYLGAVARDDDDGTVLHGFMLERLCGVRRGSAAWHQRNRIRAGLNAPNEEELAAAILDLAEGDEALPASVRKSLKRLVKIHGRIGEAMFDLSAGNFMMRPDTEELVFSDPLMSGDVASKD